MPVDIDNYSSPPPRIFLLGNDSFMSACKSDGGQQSNIETRKSFRKKQ